MATRCDSHIRTDLCNYHNLCEVLLSNVEYWNCKLHRTDDNNLPKLKSGGSYTCSTHDGGEQCATNIGKFETYSVVLALCTGHKTKDDSHISQGASSLNNVTSGSVELLSTVHQLYDNINAILNERKQHSMYSRWGGAMDNINKPGARSLVKSLILVALNEVMQKIDDDTITVGNAPSGIATRKISNAQDINTIITSSNNLMHDCICYSDCNGYSVCYCYGNCNHY